MGDGGLRGCELLTVAVGPLHVMLHVALLREADAAHFALEGLLASVLDHVDLQCALLVEGFVALSAFEGTFPCKNKQTNNPELNRFLRNRIPPTLPHNPSQIHSIAFLLPQVATFSALLTNDCF